ncbi:hypothetical protein MMC07_006702 [Pseudocyphellaria aurata]|nr:hypothetical protein [Pseudocyphellaria aurata]
MGQHRFQIAASPKAIACVWTGPDEQSGSNEESSKVASPSVIFTHGAGGTLASEAIATFSLGFGAQLPILCFQGTVNLKSRVKMFNIVIENQTFSACLAGRSMGARAAVMAASDATSRLILVSYPLHTNKEVRDQILVNLAPEMQVIFVSGDRDNMCELQRLEAVRGKMRCKTWRIVVEGADHGMNMRPKAATADVVKKSGEVVAAWIEKNDECLREGKIFWNDEGYAQWSGWCSEAFLVASSSGEHESRPEAPLQVNSSKRKRDVKGARGTDAVEAVSKRTRKSRKD